MALIDANNPLVIVAVILLVIFSGKIVDGTLKIMDKIRKYRKKKKEEEDF